MKMQDNVVEKECAENDKQSRGEGKIGIILTALALPRLYACHKLGPGFPTPYVEVFFCGSRWGVDVVDIGRIVDHHWLS